MTPKQIAEIFHSEQLSPFLARHNIGSPDATVISDDARARLEALLARFSDPHSLLALLAPFRDETDYALLTTDLEYPAVAIARVAIRNSALDAQLNKGLSQDALDELLNETAIFLARQEVDLPESYSLSDDPFEGIDSHFPIAWEAMKMLSSIKGGEVWQGDLPSDNPLVLPLAEESSSEDVSPATARHFDAYLVHLLQQAKAQDSLIFVPALSAVTRNSEKIFNFLEVVITNGLCVASPNIYISQHSIHRSEVVHNPYSEEKDLAIDENIQAIYYNEKPQRMVRDSKPAKHSKTQGRNDLCACGTGKKYKHCCGA